MDLQHFIPCVVLLPVSALHYYIYTHLCTGIDIVWDKRLYKDK